MNTGNRHQPNIARIACRAAVHDANEAARGTREAAPEKRREGLFVPFAAFASLAGAAGLPFVSF